MACPDPLAVYLFTPNVGVRACCLLVCYNLCVSRTELIILFGFELTDRCVKKVTQLNGADFSRGKPCT